MCTLGGKGGLGFQVWLNAKEMHFLSKYGLPAECLTIGTECSELIG